MTTTETTLRPGLYGGRLDLTGKSYGLGIPTATARDLITEAAAAYRDAGLPADGTPTITIGFVTAPADPPFPAMAEWVAYWEYTMGSTP